MRTLVRGLGAVTPPAGFVEELLAIGAADDAEDAEPGTTAPAVDLAAVRTHRRGRSRFAALAVGAAAAVALVVAVALPERSSNRPALATEVRVHQAGRSDDLLDQLVAQLQTQYDVRIDQAAVAQASTR